MFWTFLYRSSDCFSSSILRSCEGKTIKTHSEAHASGGELNHLVWYKGNRNLSNVPSPHWLPSMIRLPFSFFALPHLAKKENDYRWRTTVLTWGWILGQNTQGATVGFHPFGPYRPQHYCPSSNIAATLFVFKSPANYYTKSLCEQMFHIFHFEEHFHFSELTQGSASSQPSTLAIRQAFPHRIIISKSSKTKGTSMRSLTRN